MTTAKQRAWALYYAECNNATEAAVRAGYSKDSANRRGYENCLKSEVMALVNEYRAKMEEDSIAKGKEIRQFLTAVMRGEISEEVIASDAGTPVPIAKTASLKDRLKAAELEGKCIGLFTENIQISEVPKIVDDI